MPAGNARSTAREPAPCICPTAVRSLGRLHGVSMGRGTVRLATTAGCLEHDACHGWTQRRRAAYASTRPWSVGPWCPLHGGKDCPDG